MQTIDEVKKHCREVGEGVEAAVAAGEDLGAKFAEVLGPDTLLNAYRKKFVFAVTGGGSQWFVEAVLMPTVRANLAGTATRRASSPSA